MSGRRLWVIESDLWSYERGKPLVPGLRAYWTKLDALLAVKEYRASEASGWTFRVVCYVPRSPR